MAQGKPIVIHASDNDFFTGYQRGFLHYVTQDKGTTLTDDRIKHFLLDTLMNEHASDRYNTGFIAGWFAALYHIPYRLDSPSVPLQIVKGGQA